jgi:hypothetical protein
MTRLAVYGTAQGLDGRDAAIKATQMALDQLGALKPVLAIALIAEEFDPAEVLSGLVGLLGDTPLWGVGSLRPLSGDTEKPRTVVVALIAGTDLKAQVLWLPSYGEDSPEAARQLLRVLRGELLLPQAILLAADGVSGSMQPFCSALADLPIPVSGCLSSGGYTSGKTFLFGKNQSGSGAMAAALLSGRFRVGSGLGQGWLDTGLNFTVTKAHDVWVQSLDGKSVTEVYAQIFGRPAREWSFPPLNEMVRLYPLGIERAALQQGELILRSPLRVEIDGSLRMSAPVSEGAVAHLMLGDPESCLRAAEMAVSQALAGLGGARPILALAFVDLAWAQLFEMRPNQVAQTLQEALGSIPLAGAYTLGQVVRSSPNSAPILSNQGLTVTVIGAME